MFFVQFVKSLKEQNCVHLLVLFYCFLKFGEEAVILALSPFHLTCLEREGHVSFLQGVVPGFLGVLMSVVT